MDIIKQFMKIGGFKTPEELEAYGEDRFFNDFPEARKYAKGGSIEAYPQIATFDNAFSYGVKPGPQYLAHGGSAFPQAQTEQQFFIPIYTDVYNPYNKAMGGSNVEMYPNAKTTPHWGPTNIWFQDGGEGQPENNKLDRLGVLNTTGAFVTNLKQKADQANKKNAMMGAVSKYGFRNGGPLNKYEDKGAVNEGARTPLTSEELELAKKFNINDPGFNPEGTRLKIKQLQRENWIDEQMQTKPNQGGMIYDPAMAADVRASLQQNAFPFGPGYRAGQPLYAHPLMIAEYPLGPYGYPQGNMSNFLDDYFAYTTSGAYPGSTTRGRVSVDGRRAGNFYGNMPLIKAMMPELYGKGNFADMMTNNADFRNRAEAMGLTGYKEPTGLKKLWGSREYTFNQRVPWEAPTVTLDPKKAAVNTPSSSTPASSSSTGPGSSQSVSTGKKSFYNPGMDMSDGEGYQTPTSQNTQGANTPASYMPSPVYNSKGTFTNPQGSFDDEPTYNYDPTVRSTTTLQDPSNANSMDAATAQKKASMMNPNVNQAFIDAQQSGAPYRTPVGPVVGPDGYAYGGYTGYKFGGSYNQGDVVYMTDDEIAEFVRNGGQIEEME